MPMTESIVPPAHVLVTSSTTSSPSPSKTPRERPNEPTFTPLPPTALPTIPTFTPTFDVSTIVTVTPASPAACPKENPTAVATFVTPNSDGYYDMFGPNDILTYLNSGGALAPFVANPARPVSDTLLGTIVDLTGDDLSEVVYIGIQYSAILGCKDGKYQNLFELAPGDFSLGLEDILDLNKDGIPELIFYSFSRHGFAYVYIIGWDGNQFRSLINVGTDSYTGAAIDSVFASTYHRLTDTNGDGLKEIAIVYDVNEFCDGLGGLNFCDGTPAREQTTTLAWNGQNYVDLKPITYAPPKYQFQAIQDGDQQARYGKYTEALSFYQAAIFDDRLEWWSPEREEYEVQVHRSQFDDPRPTAPSPPTPDNTEYPRLAAYAYYRIMLLHIVQGHESDARTVYKTLQQKFGSNPYGLSYAEMATAFWDTYQSTHNMYDGCAAAIQYAAEHPEILVPLGSDYHGSQSHIYVPADVCPFRQR